MEILRTVLELAILLGIWFVVTYVKKIPDQLHQKNRKVFELEMNKQLEAFKNDLSREIELLKINESNLYIYKVGEFEKLVDFMLVNMLDEAYIKRLEKDSKTQQEFKKKMMSLGTKLFFFASDETVKKFVDWRVASLKASEPGFDSNTLIIKLGELIVLVRKDLGYKDTECTIDDFLNIILTDWEGHKARYNL